MPPDKQTDHETGGGLVAEKFIEPTHLASGTVLTVSRDRLTDDVTLEITGKDVYVRLGLPPADAEHIARSLLAAGQMLADEGSGATQGQHRLG